MSELSSVVSKNFDRYYERVAAQIRTLVQPLSEDEFWVRPFSFGNSVGHLILHLTGNLNYYVGAQIAGTGYVRNRDLEFTDPSRRPKTAVMKDFDAAIAMVESTLARQSEADWNAPYTGKGMEDAENRFTVFLRCVAHLQHHAAQMIYLVKKS